MKRKIVDEKTEKVKRIRELFKQYNAIGIANLHKVRASQLQEIRKQLQNTAHLQVMKNVLFERAISDTSVNIEDLKEHLIGSNLFIFTNLNPFKLALLLQKSKVRAFARARDIATEDIIVLEGNTGLSPGPIISQLQAVGIPTRIESGSVWINRDTIVAKKGEVITENLAPILSKLGIKAVEMGLLLEVILYEKTVLKKEELNLNLEYYRNRIVKAAVQALNISLKSVIPTKDNVMLLLRTSFIEAYNLALNATILTPRTIEELLRKSIFEATSLSFKLRKD